MTDQKLERPDPLERRVAALSPDVAPVHDLWPGVAARLDRRPARAASALRPRGAERWLQLGIALAAGYALATWLPLPRAASDRGSTPTRAAFEIVETVRPALATLPAKTRAVVEADLSGLERDWVQIEQALVEDPDNPLLRELRTNAEDHAASVLEQMNRLTRPLSTEGVEI